MSQSSTTWTIRAFERRDADAVIELWRDAGLTRPWNDPHQDIERKLKVQPELFIVADAPGVQDRPARVVGTVMAGYDGHRGWLYYLATASEFRGCGIGRALVAEAEQLLLEMGCPKVQLMVRPDNATVLGFYDQLGYQRFDVVNAGKRLVSDEV